MSIDPSIRLGDLITLAIAIIGGLAFLWSLRGDMRMISRDVQSQGKKLEKLEAIVTIQAVQTERLDGLERRIEELRHGRGWVTEDVSGLYTRHGKVQGNG